MQSPFNPKQVVSFEELFHVSGSPTGSPYKVTCGERDIYQGGVFGDGESVASVRIYSID